VTKFYEVSLLAEGGGTLKLNEQHIVGVKKRTAGGYRVWLSHEMEVGDEPDQLLKNAGTADPRTVKVLNVSSTDLDALFVPQPKAGIAQ
jgi:hypothetical protein